MKNLAYQDRVGGDWRVWNPPQHRERTLFMPSRWTRFWTAYKDLQGLGNVRIGLAETRRVRTIMVRGF